MSPAPLRALVVDDEPLARRRVRELLGGAPDVEVAGEAGSGRAAVEAIRALRPDVVFLDVQMPGLSGLDVVREVGPAAMPVTVFVTAYDAHAVAAFDLAAVDYLLKPFEDDRFYEALGRARRSVRLQAAEQLQRQLASLLGPVATPPPPAPAAAPYLQRVTVETRGLVRVVPVDRIDYVTSDGSYAELHVGTEVHVVRSSLQALEDRLDPARFVRVHRGTLVQLDRVESVRVASGGDYQARLLDGTRLRVSRSRYDDLMRRLSEAPGR